MRPNLLSLTVCVALLGACRSQLDVQSKSGAPVPVESPEETGATTPESPQPTPAAPPATPPTAEPTRSTLNLARTYFQTRDTIFVPINRELLQGAASLSVYNVTNANAPVTLVDEYEIPEDFAVHEATFALTSVTADSFLLEFYPVADSWSGRFVYGNNKLEIVFNDPDTPRIVTAALTLEDFPALGTTVTSFEDGSQVSAGFQGWVTPLTMSTVSDGMSYLTHGHIDIVNPR